MIESSKIHNMINEVNYQEGSIISKILQKKSSGNITLFAFDKGQNLSPHSAPYDALAYIIDGEAEIMIDQNYYNLKANDLIVMPANVQHAVKATDKMKMILTMLKSTE